VKIPIRDLWKYEPTDFTPWLIDNLDQLSEAMQQEIIVTDAKRETPAGKYSVDILGKIGEDIVVIENQLKKSDHSHLGQCITYAAIHKAKYLIWVAETFQKEELSSIDWLNENFSVDSGIKFFAVEVSVWKTEDNKGNLSEYAIPHFKVLREPDVELKEIRDEKHAESVSVKKEKRKDFFKKFTDSYGKINSKWLGRKSDYNNWCSRSTGISGVSFSLSFKGHTSMTDPTIALDIYPNPPTAEEVKKIFLEIYKDKESIEKKWSQVSSNELIWINDDDNESRKYRSIRVESDLKIDFSTANEELKNKCMDWFIENMIKFENTFTPILNKLEK
tara:strand:+ start:95 stop:1090 length:996 start_codon:yes stop_codon:yes gene_type:complete